ncbi:MAG: YHS domain-containing protein [Desulfobacteraceae bacterium]|nr:YHS domain-containing protein [Desulfobacteraceae bacterium]
MRSGGGCCGGHGHDSHHHDSGTGSPATNGGKDPVCGMDVDDNTPLHSEHQGRTVRFCSERCKRLFDLNPGNYR